MAKAKPAHRRQLWEFIGEPSLKKLLTHRIWEVQNRNGNIVGLSGYFLAKDCDYGRHVKCPCCDRALSYGRLGVIPVDNNQRGILAHRNCAITAHLRRLNGWRYGVDWLDTPGELATRAIMPSYESETRVSVSDNCDGEKMFTATLSEGERQAAIDAEAQAEALNLCECGHDSSEHARDALDNFMSCSQCECSHFHYRIAA